MLNCSTVTVDKLLSCYNQFLLILWFDSAQPVSVLSMHLKTASTNWSKAAN